MSEPACSSEIRTLHVGLRDRSSFSSPRCARGLDSVGMSEIHRSMLAGCGCGGGSQVRLPGLALVWTSGVERASFRRARRGHGKRKKAAAALELVCLE